MVQKHCLQIATEHLRSLFIYNRGIYKSNPLIGDLIP